MHNLFIAYAPDTNDTRKIVDQVRGAFEATAFTVTVKNAAGSLLPDLAGADLLVFGLQKAGGGEIPADFAELVRSLKGANLAGRVAAIFSVGSEKASARLRKTLRDTEVSVSDEDPVFGDQKPARQSDVAEWAKKVTAFFEGVRRVRA
jgi:flavodoxin